jgi:hypothetical protein
MELAGLNGDLEYREEVLQYAKGRLETVLRKVEEEINGNDSARTET